MLRKTATLSGLQIRLDRFDSGTRLHNILCIFPKKIYLIQDIVQNFSYTIRTQNFAADLLIPILMFESIS